MPDRFLGTDQVAEALNLNTSDVLRLIHRGALPAKKLISRGKGKRPRLRVLESELDKFMTNCADATDEPEAQIIDANTAPRRTRTRRPAELQRAKSYY